MVKTIIAASVVAIALSLGGSSLVAHADEPSTTAEQPSSIQSRTVNDPTQAGQNTTDDNSAVNPISEPIDDTSDNKDTTVDIVEVEEETEVEEEPAMWPVYISLGALAAAILVFIILNLLGRKYKK